MPVDMPYSESELDPVFRQICQMWMTKIEHAKAHKKKVFGNAAEECQRFFDGPKDWDELMGTGVGVQSAEGFPSPAFKVSVNKTFEFVTLFGPALYYQNPVRTAKPYAPLIPPPEFFMDPMQYQATLQQEDLRIKTDGLRGIVLEAALNWTSNDFELADESRMAIDEGLIQGRGCMWTELHQPPGCNFRVARSTWDSTSALLVDPDAFTMKRAKWIARKCVHPVWQVERDFGLRRGSLRGHCESHDQQADIQTREDAQYDRKRGLTNDLICYYKIYSKMGIGGRLQGFNPSLRPALDMFGDYCYCVVAEGVPFLLNLPPDFIRSPESADPAAVFAKTDWPTPFWASSGWPVCVLDFHVVPNSPWPLPHLKAGMGELKFLNWAMSFLMTKIFNTSRDFIAVKKSASEEIKEAILAGKDLTLLEIDAEHGTIDEIIQFLQHPQMNADIWKVIEAVEDKFDKRVGLTELMYGGGGATQIRSAEEVKERAGNTSVRPDDMAQQVETWQAAIARNETFCARWHLNGTDVQPILGPLGAMAWDQYVATKDLQTAAHQLECRIESGSTRRPNRNTEIQQINQAFTALAPILQGYAQQTGDTTPLNNLVGDLAKTLDLDPAHYQMSALPPPAPAPPTGPPGSAENEASSSPPAN